MKDKELTFYFKDGAGVTVTEKWTGFFCMAEAENWGSCRAVQLSVEKSHTLYFSSVQLDDKNWVAVPIGTSGCFDNLKKVK